MNAVLAYAKARFLETSTLRGLIYIAAGLLGVSLTDSDALTLVAGGQVLAGIIGAALPDKSNA